MLVAEGCGRVHKGEGSQRQPARHPGQLVRSAPTSCVMQVEVRSEIKQANLSEL